MQMKNSSFVSATFYETEKRGINVALLFLNILISSWKTVCIGWAHGYGYGYGYGYGMFV